MQEKIKQLNRPASAMRRLVLNGLLGTAIGFGAAAPAAAADYPEKNIRFVIPFGAGGGSDVLARTIGSVIKDMDLTPVDIIYENLPGSSGARGYRDVSRRAGDPYQLATVSVSFFTTPLLGGAPFKLEDFTPVSAIAMSPYVLVVRPDSKVQSFDDLKGHERLTTGSVGVVSDARLLADMMSDEMKVRVDVVPFDGEGEIITGVLGGHLDFMWGNLGEVLPQIQAGTMRAIAVSTGERLEALPDVPSFKEKGYDVEHVMLRGVVMPKDVPADVVKYWEGVFEKVAASDMWKERYLDRFKEQPRYEGAEKFAKSLTQTRDDYAAVLKKLGLLKD